MLKKFLKLFKHDEEPSDPELEGSYLDYLLSYVEQGVEQELQLCDEHDPLLLVITQTLRVAMPGVWSDVITRPLRDPVVPPRRSPPPPPSGPPPPSTLEAMSSPDERLVETSEFEASELQGDDDPESAETEAVEALQQGEEEVGGGDAQEVEEEVEDATIEVERDFNEEAATGQDEGERLDEDSELIEEITADRMVAYDATGEFHPLKGERRDAFKEDGDELPRLDHRAVLQAGRVFLGMLIENDRLPIELQLGLAELMLSRDLLLGQHLGAADLEQKAQQLLRIVERKFSEGQFSQARILLQLFQTDRATRVRNDRNIFYEDMIQRLGIRRRHPVDKALLQTYEDLKLGDEPLRELATWLDHHIFIKLHLFCRRAEEVERWTRLADRFSYEGGGEMLLRYLPPKRWRPFFRPEEGSAEGAAAPLALSLAHDDASLEELIARHVHIDTLSSYVIGHMRTCYFVLRAVGDTGLERYLDTFFEWAESELGLNATVFLPELYRRSMGETDLMRSIFNDLYGRYMKEPSERWLATLTPERVEQATERAVEALRGYNLNDVPPGNYDLGGFIYDELFGMSYPSPEFAFKLHRLT